MLYCNNAENKEKNPTTEIPLKIVQRFCEVQSQLKQPIVLFIYFVFRQKSSRSTASSATCRPTARPPSSRLQLPSLQLFQQGEKKFQIFSSNIKPIFI
jgi:hypothetical protein